MEPLRRDAQTWACYALILAMAVLQGGLGGLLPFIRAEFGFSHTVLSLHITAMAVGGLIAALVTDRVRRRVGRRAVLLAAAVLAALGGLLLVTGRSAVWTVSAVVLNGVAVVGALIVAQALLVEKYGPVSSRLIGELNLGYAIGAVVALFGLPWLAASVLGWRALPALPTVLLLVVVLPWLWRTGRTEPQPVSAESGTPVGRWMLRRPRLAFVAMALCVAVEWSFLYWLATYLVDAAGHTPEAAAQYTAEMWIAVLIGRAAGTLLLPRFGAARVLTGSLLVALVASGMLWYAQAGAMAVVAAGFAGTAAANLYPGGIALVVSGFGLRPDSAVARAMLWPGVVGIGFPLLLGLAADALGLSTAFWVVPLIAVLALLAVRLTGARAVDGPQGLVEAGRPAPPIPDEKASAAAAGAPAGSAAAMGDAQPVDGSSTVLEGDLR